MIPYGRQSIGDDDIKAVTDILSSPWLTQGPAVLEFEKALAKKGGAKYAVAVANGTAALHLAYLVAGLKPGDEVITTPNTFVATSNMLLVLGVKPVFADIRLDTYNLDEAEIEKLITKKTKGIVAVDFAGQPANYQKIKTLAKKHGLLLIEDACHALGAKYQGRSIGSLSDLSVFSFHPVKPITTGEGGAILTNNENFYKQLLLLRSHGIEKDQTGFNVMIELGYNYRLTDIQAALGLSQLKKLERFNNKRRQVVAWYYSRLQNNNKIILPQEVSGVLSAWHLFVIRTKDIEDRLPLYNFLKANGIGVNFHYPAVYSHPYYRGHGFRHTRCPNMDLYHASAITLPLFPDLKKSEVKKIADLINGFYKK